MFALSYDYWFWWCLHLALWYLAKQVNMVTLSTCNWKTIAPGPISVIFGNCCSVDNSIAFLANASPLDSDDIKPIRSYQYHLASYTKACLNSWIFTVRFSWSLQARPLAVHLLNNTLGLPGMPSTRAAPGRSAMEQNLAELVIHTVTVLQCSNHVTVCEPLRLMMENPAALRVKLFSW